MKKDSNSRMNKLVIDVITNDFPSIKISQIIGLKVTDKMAVGQFIEKGTNISYSFSFEKESPRVLLKRFI